MSSTYPQHIVENKRQVLQVYNKTKLLDKYAIHTIYNEPYLLFLDKYDPVPKIGFDRDMTSEQIRQSMKTSKRIVRELSQINLFEYFVTLTFKNNRYDYDKCINRLTNWCKNIRKNDKEFAYLFIPEKHKDGAIHIHGLIKNTKTLNLVTAQTKRKNTYNINRWRFGYSTAVKIKQQYPDIDKVANYMTKYITKDMIHIKHRKKIFTSQNLKRPTILYNQEIPVESYTTYTNTDIIIKKSVL